MFGDSPFRIRGVVEGFYGTYYTFPERNDLIRFLGGNGFNFYLYGPKNDRQHRVRWWVPYPAPVMEEFAQSIRIAQEAGVTFCYAISFGVPLNYASHRDFEVVTEKLRGFFDRGCRAFGVLLDDVALAFSHDDTRRAFRSVAEAHADFCNRLLDWMRTLDASCSLYLCPTEYHGAPPFGDYLHDLGAGLDPDIAVFYTGPDIWSSRITATDAAGFAEAVGRPPLIWDNYPVNDLERRSEMHLGPLLGRDPLLYTAVKGYVSNVMNQKEASKIALLTVAEYLSEPQHYDAAGAWRRALLRVGGESYDALGYVAENSLRSCLQEEEAPQMDRLVAASLASLRCGESVAESKAVGHLSSYLDTLDESCYQLKYRMGNLALRQNLLPWIEVLEARVWMGRGALKCLEAIEEGADRQPSLRFLDELIAETGQSRRRIGGTGLLNLAEYARQWALENREPLSIVAGGELLGSVESSPLDPEIWSVSDKLPPDSAEIA